MRHPSPSIPAVGPASRSPVWAGVAFVVAVFWAHFSWAQTSSYRSVADDLLTVSKVTVAPMFDNVKNIYAVPLTQHLEKLIEEDKQWKFAKWPERTLITPEDMEEKTESVKMLLRRASADAVLSSRLSRGPSGISIKLNLFLASDGQLILQETLKDFTGFDLKDLREQLSTMYQKIKSRLPFSGQIMSRKGQLVTIDLGGEMGIKDGDEISVIQVLKLDRHPKFKFLVNTEKEILGKLKITKAEPTMSFATVLFERDTNVVKPGMKIQPVSFVAYNEVPTDAAGKMQSDLNDRPDGPVAFGDRSTEWVPTRTPTFGKVGLSLGFGTYTVSNSLSTAGGISATSGLVPSIHVNGEVWINPNWFANMAIRQYVTTLDNSYVGSTPSKLSLSTNQMTMQLGYNFLLQEQFFGPKISLSLGLSQFKNKIDNSTPAAFTSMNFGGTTLGLSASFPVSDQSPMLMGAGLNYHLAPSVDESPVTSGSATSVQVTSFGVFGSLRYSERYRIRGDLLYDTLSANFSGTGTRGANASTASHSLTTIAIGLEYLF